MFLGRPSGRPLSINTCSAWHDISVGSGGVSLKFGTSNVVVWVATAEKVLKVRVVVEQGLTPY